MATEPPPRELEVVRDLLDQKLTETNELIGKYSDIIASNIPDTIKQAIKDRWELEIEHLQLRVLTRYPADEQRKDHRRVIKVETALEILKELDDALAQKCAKGGFGIILGAFFSIPKVFLLVTQAVTAFLDFLFYLIGRYGWFAVVFRFRVILSAIFTFVVIFFLLLVRTAFSASVLEQLESGVIPLFEERDKFAKRLRDAALPQTSGTRRWKRAQTRR